MFLALGAPRCLMKSFSSFKMASWPNHRKLGSMALYPEVVGCQKNDKTPVEGCCRGICLVTWFSRYGGFACLKPWLKMSQKDYRKVFPYRNWGIWLFYSLGRLLWSDLNRVECWSAWTALQPLFQADRPRQNLRCRPPKHTWHPSYWWLRPLAAPAPWFVAWGSQSESDVSPSVAVKKYDMIGISTTLRVEVERAFYHYFSLAAKAQYLQYLQVIQCMEFGDKLYTSWQYTDSVLDRKYMNM